MAEIVQLKEDGEGKYMKTHVQAVDGLTEKLEDFVDKASDETITGQKKFDKVPNVSVDGFDQPVLAGISSYTFSAADIFSEYSSTITGASGAVFRIGNICVIAASITTKGATVATKALKLPSGFKLSKKGAYQVSLNLTRNANQDGYARALMNTDDVSAVRILSGDGSNYVSGVYMTDDPFPVG